jgi:DNA-binding beta-propeller fold protein YncE
MTASRFAALCLGSALCLGLGVTGSAQAASSGYHVVDRISGPDGGWDYIRVDEANNRLLAAHGTSVMTVDLATKAVGSMAPGVILHDAMPVNGGGEVLVTNGGTNTAVFVNGKTGAVVATVDTGKGPDAAAFDPKTGLALVMDHAGGQITLIDPRTHKVAGTIEVGGTLEAAASDGTGKAYVNVENKNEIAAVDIAGRKVLAHWALAGCDGPTGLAYDKADKLLIAACDGSTVVVDPKTGAVVQTLATGKGADGIAFDQKQKLAFVPSGRDGTLAVIAFVKGRGTIVDTVPTQVSARTIAIDQRTGRVYLPAAKFGAATTPGRRPPMTPGTFQILVVGK